MQFLEYIEDSLFCALRLIDWDDDNFFSFHMSLSVAIVKEVCVHLLKVGVFQNAATFVSPNIFSSKFKFIFNKYLLINVTKLKALSFSSALKL